MAIKWVEDIVIGLLQRVIEARVDIGTECVATIGAGLLVLVGVRPTDDEASALRLVDRLLQYRVFGDENGKMNLSLGQTQGDLLLVPQFTLAADTHKGLRPGFSKSDVMSKSGSKVDLGRALSLLVADGKLTKKGDRRMTRYWVK